MRLIVSFLLSLAALLPPTAVSARTFSTAMPACRVAGASLPAPYPTLGQRQRAFAWARQAMAPDDREAGGPGDERVDGSGIRDHYTFLRVDLDGDGICDWFLTTSTPLSTGGDRDSINTLYLAKPGGRWLRVGAQVPAGQPDGLGRGQSDQQQLNFLFGEDLAVVVDTGSGIPYFITQFYSRHDRRNSLPGYRVLAWDGGAGTLRVLDKWQPGSLAAEAYAFFRQHGALLVGGRGPQERVNFDPEVEAWERQAVCIHLADPWPGKPWPVGVMKTCPGP